MKAYENLAKMKKELFNLIACTGLNDDYNIHITIQLYSIQRWARERKTPELKILGDYCLTKMQLYFPP